MCCLRRSYSTTNPEPELIKQRRGLAKVIIDCRFPAWFKEHEVPPVSDFNEFPEEIRKKAVRIIDKALDQRLRTSSETDIDRVSR